MDEQERRSELMSALATEHFVLQTATSTAVSESASRASLYVMSLSSVLVATGFVSQTPVAFGPFLATALPGVFILGVFTFLRLVDNATENLNFLAGIARIRGYYRTLSPDAARYFPAEGGRWPESTLLAQRRGPLPLLFTSASTIAVVNSLVAGAGVALLMNEWITDGETVAVVLPGVVVALALLAVSYAFQRWRYGIFGRVEPLSESLEPPTED